MNHKLYHYLPCFVLSLVISVLLICFQLTYFTAQVILKPSLYSEALSKNSITNLIYDDLETYFTRISAATGVPAEVYMKSVTKANLSSAVNSLIQDSLNYLKSKDSPKPEIKYSFEQLEQDIADYFENYANENNIEKNEEYKKLLNSTIETAESQISGKLDVLFLKRLSDTSLASEVHVYAGFINAAMYICAAAAIALWALIFYIIRHHKLNMLYWVGISVFVSSAAILIPSAYLHFSNYFSNFFVKTPYIQKSVTGLINTVLAKTVTFEFVMTALGIILICSYAIFKSGLLKINRKK